jgi:acetyl/propionyl-CoA carboxylase alpha subunit
MTEQHPIYHSVLIGNEEKSLEITSSDLDGLDLVRVSDTLLHVLQDQKSYLIDVIHADYATKEFTLRIDGKEVHIKLRDDVENRVHAMGFDVSKNHVKLKQISSPMPGLVLKILASEGDQVTEGQPVLVLEAMKMENVLSAPTDGIISEILVTSGKNVNKGQVLVRLD